MGAVQYTVDGVGCLKFSTPNPRAMVEPGANGALGEIGMSFEAIGSWCCFGGFRGITGIWVVDG